MGLYRAPNEILTFIFPHKRWDPPSENAYWRLHWANTVSCHQSNFSSTCTIIKKKVSPDNLENAIQACNAINITPNDKSNDPITKIWARVCILWGTFLKSLEIRVLPNDQKFSDRAPNEIYVVSTCEGGPSKISDFYLNICFFIFFKHVGNGHSKKDLCCTFHFFNF